jgi:ankyrin repeat protein
MPKNPSARKSIQQQLFAAIRSESLPECRRCIRDGADLAEFYDNNRTPLTQAAAVGGVKIVEELLKSGASPMPNKDGVGALHEAVTGNTKLVSILLAAHPLSVYETTIQMGARIVPRPLLHLAAEQRNLKLCGLFLRAGSNPIALDVNGNNALHVLFNRDSLLQTNDDLRARRHNSIAKLLLKAGIPINQRNNEGKTALHMSLQPVRPQACRLLLERKAEVNITDNEGRTALHFAAGLMEGYHKFNEIMLNWAPIRAAMTMTNTSPPEETKVSSSYETIVPLFLANGSDIGATDNAGATPLHWAAKQGDILRIKQLLTAGAKIEATDLDGNTSMHHAAAYGFTEAVRFLLQSGAALDAFNHDGDSPENVAEKKQAEWVQSDLNAPKGFAETIIMLRVARELDALQTSVPESPGNEKIVKLGTRIRL